MREKQLENRTRIICNDILEDNMDRNTHEKESSFVIVKDKKVADEMIAAGLQMMYERYGQYVFLNSPVTNFSEINIDTKNIMFTNKLSF